MYDMYDWKDVAVWISSDGIGLGSLQFYICFVFFPMNYADALFFLANLIDALICEEIDNLHVNTGCPHELIYRFWLGNICIKILFQEKNATVFM